MVRVGADFSAITKQSKKATGSIVTMISSVNRATGKLEGACAKMTGALRGLGSALGVAGLAVLAKEAADAYNEVQENNAALAQVMKTPWRPVRQSIRVSWTCATPRRSWAW